MNIAIDTSPLSETSGHKVRGVGMYVKRLLAALKEYSSEHTVIGVENPKQLPANIDILHYPYFEPFFVTLPLHKTVKTVVTIHDLTPIKFPTHFPRGIKGEIKWQTQKRLVKLQDGIITDSQSSQHDIQNYIGIPESKITVIPLAADKVFRPLPLSEKEKAAFLKKNNLPETFVVYIGDVTWNKNIPRLLEAIEQVGIPIVLIGKVFRDKTQEGNAWNNDLVSVQKHIQDNKLCIIPGFLSDQDLVTYLNLAKALVMPSLYEGFGLPVLEAMQAGCPVITSHEGSLPEIGKDAVVYVDAYETNSIVHAIQELVTNPSLQNTLKAAGINRAKEYSWEKVAKDTLSFYEKISKQ